ncbi:MAG TPA: YsnF/AvaK domain-containing protein [Candidatus Tectomicrobia bacterium]
MHRAGSSKVQDKDGLWGTVVSGSPPLPSSAAQVVVQTESGQQCLVPTELLVQQPDGSYALPRCLAEFAYAGSAPMGHQDAPMVVPVLVEELEVQKRPVETGKVRITKVVHERETTVDEPLWHDKVAITRVPIQRVVEGPVPVREEHGTTIISVVEEVLVVEKRWMLREEIHIRQQRIETHQPQRITLRSEDVQVERVSHADEET